MSIHSWKNDLRFARALVSVSLRGSTALRGAFLIQIAFMALNNLTFFVFWWALFEKVPTIHGWELRDVALLFGVVASGYGVGVTFAAGTHQLGRYIDEGELDSFLAQPKPVLLYALGSRSYPSGIGDFLSGLALIAFSGRVPLVHAPHAALAIVASGMVFVASGTIFYSLAFWIGRNDSLARQLWNTLIAFSSYPEPLFGGWLRVVLFSVLPAGFVGYVPAGFLRHPTWGGAAAMIASAIGYLCLAIGVFHRGLRRYSSGSRFGVFG